MFRRIGYTMATIRDGRRCSAADAFLHPVRARPNLHIALHTEIDQIVFEDGRAVEYRAAREGLLSAGAIATPRILQLSGIGVPEMLATAGVPAVVDSPHVGARMREHRVLDLQCRLREDVGYNRFLSTAEGPQQALAEYEATGDGPMGAPSFDIVGFVRARPGLERSDAQVQIEQVSGLIASGYPLRPDSEGRIRITSDYPQAPLDIDPGYFSAEHDRTTSIAIFHCLRRLLATDPLARWIAEEAMPGSSVGSDQEILESGLVEGGCGYHAVGTAAIGPRGEDVVDASLLVRGVSGLRVADASVLLLMVSGKLVGPVMALAWRAADLVLSGE